MNRNDRRIFWVTAAVAMLAGAALLYFLFTTYHSQTNSQPSPRRTPHTTRHTTRRTPRDAHARTTYYAVAPTHKAERFCFDPNTADSTQLLRLGLQPWQVRNIYRYRARGGIYRTREDFARLYGLTRKQYRELAPYIRISADYLPAATLIGRRHTATADHTANGTARDSLEYPVKLKPGQHIELNTADADELRRVPGIGHYYAAQILRYGRWLGGYVSVDQLDEIENFPAEAKQYFVVDHPTPRKLPVNSLSTSQLKRHPYINYFQAKAIVDYRRRHGPLKSLQQLSFSRDFPPEAIRRLEPYVEY
ncbi:MAG: helix-hairpin-helix domain-containing protein [Prevotella sp.]|nr:helix-hairpin-helix domain-containing protein [Prevotella sp.]